MINRTYKKHDFPVDQIRRFLECGPTVLVSSRWRGRDNIMTMNWHTVMEFTPALLGCVIAGSNHSFEMIRKSRECVINLPETHLIDTVVGIGNCSGDDTDKFETFNLSRVAGAVVKTPLIGECYANFECRLADARLVNKYNFFIFEVVKAHVAARPKFPNSLHYRGDAVFMESGPSIRHRKGFKTQNL